MIMKVSIITVSYNAADTIEQTINSVLSQNYEDVEYIIIDGGSTDGTVDIIKKYSAQLAYWVSEPDKGLYDAMNKGIQKSTGDVIGMINSDDWYAPNTIAYIVARFQKDVSTVLIHGDIIRVNLDGSPRDRCRPFFSGEEIWHEMIVHHPTCFLRREIYERYGLYATKYKVAGDYEFFLRLYTQGIPFTYMADDIAYFRDDGVSASSFKVGMKEVCEISQSYGYSKARALLWYYCKVCKHEISLLCTKLSLGVIVKLYHAILGHGIQKVEEKD